MDEKKAQAVFEALQAALQAMKDNKPNDRSEKDRYSAIAITDLEKIISFYGFYVA